MTNQQGTPEALLDPSPDQLRAIARTARNSSGSASDDCGPLAYVLHGWRAAVIAFRAQQAAMVEAQQPAPSAAAATEVENLRKALQFYADKDHFNIADEGAWDTVSGEPQNYWCDEEGTATVEDGTIARLALAGHQIKFDADAAPQPSPTPQAASSAVLKAIRAANMQLVRTGDDEFMLVTYKNAKAQCDGGKCGIGGYCDDCPAPQADSQPAPVLDRDRIREIFMAHGFTVKEGQTDLKQYVYDAADALLRAARAPADSVTAPAAYSGNLEQELAMLIRRIVSSARRNCEDGSNVLKLANEAWAYLVRKGLNGSPLRDAGIETAPTPTPQADSVLEDAARLDWLALAGPVSICVVIDRPHDGEVEVATDDVTGYGKTLREALDAARKQGANHD